MTPTLKIKKVHPDAKLPTKAHSTDLGYDLYANHDIEIWYGATVKISTGIAVGFPKGWGGFIKDRSSMASKQLITSGGVIDEDYTGELSIIMTYTCYEDEFEEYEDKFIQIKKGDKIAQLVPIPTTNWSIEEVDSLEITNRGEKGFGSSGA
jgi:dUTP pyrophosphatase